MNLAIHIADLLMRLPQLPDQRKKRGPRKRRDEIMIIVVDQRDQIWRQCLEESNDIVAAQLAAAHDRASAIDSVNLK